MKKELSSNILCLAIMGGVMAAAWFLLEGWLRLALMACLYFAVLELLTGIVRILCGEPKPVKKPADEMIRDEDEWYFSRQDPEKLEKLRPVGWILTGVSIAVSIPATLNMGPFGFWNVACLICFAASVVLCSVFPAYFSVCHAEGEKNRKVHFPIISLLAAFFAPPFANLVNCLYSFQPITYVDWMKILWIDLAATAVFGVITSCLIPEFRRHRTEWVCMTLLSVMLVFGIITPLNTVLETRPPQIQSAVVTEYHPGVGKAPAYYVMELDDGVTIDMDANDGILDRRDYDLGQIVEVEYHQGALGMPYYCYHE